MSSHHHHAHLGLIWRRSQMVINLPAHSREWPPSGIARKTKNRQSFLFTILLFICSTSSFLCVDLTAGDRRVSQLCHLIWHGVNIALANEHYLSPEQAPPPMSSSILAGIGYNLRCVRAAAATTTTTAHSKLFQHYSLNVHRAQFVLGNHPTASPNIALFKYYTMQISSRLFKSVYT